MIGRLCGILIEKLPSQSQLLIDISGVGYEVNAPMSTFYKLPETGEEITLHTHLVVREDAQQLYGFHAIAERALFRTLIKVNGVGAKLALTILSGITTDEFVRCVVNDDSASLKRLPGVGQKTAERLIVEMRDRLTDWHTEISNLDSTTEATPVDLSKIKSATQDAISALIALGYKPQIASRAVSKIYQEGLTSEELIRLALKAAT